MNKITELSTNATELETQLFEKAKNEANEKYKNYSKNLDNLHKARTAELNNEFIQKKNELEKTYSTLAEDLEFAYVEAAGDFAGDMIDKNKELAALKKELQESREKQDAYIKAKLREEELDNKQDFYKLQLTDSSIDDINYLYKEVLPRIINKDAIYRIIWDVYYKPEYDKLMARLFKDTEKHSGIYRISSIDSGKAYIGQSVDMRTRFNAHIKGGISGQPASNQLYQEMRKYGCNRFTFEVLEEVPKSQLNEREIYWISFYKTKEFGLNISGGGARQ